MVRVSVVVRVETEHGAVEELVLSKEGEDREKVEDSLVQEMFISGSDSLVNALCDLEDPKPKRKRKAPAKKAAPAAKAAKK